MVLCHSVANSAGMIQQLIIVNFIMPIIISIYQVVGGIDINSVHKTGSHNCTVSYKKIPNSRPQISETGTAHCA